MIRTFEITVGGEHKTVYLMFRLGAGDRFEWVGAWLGEAQTDEAFWMGVFSGLKSAGVLTIGTVCYEGLQGLSEALARVYPQTVPVNTAGLTTAAEKRWTLMDAIRRYLADDDLTLDGAGTSGKKALRALDELDELMREMEGTLPHEFGPDFDFEKDLKAPMNALSLLASAAGESPQDSEAIGI